nr:HAMP domain-containing sensor histidine kinase [uncultured Devosia sp.]
MTTPMQRLARLLDPAGGDDIEHPYRRLRLNLRRVELVAWLGVLIAAVEGMFSIQRQIDHYLWACGFMGGGAILAMVLARRGQRVAPRRYRHLPEAFVIFALMASQLICYFIILNGRVASGYGLVFMACAVFFLIPPRRFIVIGLVTLAFFIAWVVASPLSGFDQINNIFNTALAVVFGMMGRWGLDRLEQANEVQKQQIAEQNAALVAINARLLRNNDELNGLMAVAAHDLRSPLFGLGNLLELAQQRPPSTPEGWQDVLRAAGSSIGSMQVLISRILEAHEADWAKDQQLVSINLHAALEASRVRNGVNALRCGVAITVDGRTNVLAAGDAARLEQVLDNLVSNAIRFSPQGAEIVLTAGVDGQPFITVADRGKGIPEAERDGLFGKFKRGSARPVHGSWGSGLGLYIARTLVANMGATIVYQPRAGGGSLFRIDFQPPFTAMASVGRGPTDKALQIG